MITVLNQEFVPDPAFQEWRTETDTPVLSGVSL